ncbi:MAG: sulfate adenylyltransferase [Arcobacter sp.]|nr:MAG: sulfate adenylyltransferase [Arcobacter sp.]
MKTQNNLLYIDKEAVATLAMARDGLLKPVTSLMNEKETNEVNKTGIYKDEIFPFPFILAPSGKRNKEVLQKAKKGDILKLICNNLEVGSIIVDEIFPINKNDRVKQIYGTNSELHEEANDTAKRLGDLAICGEYTIAFDDIQNHIRQIEKMASNIEANSISALILSGKPFHRVHEKLIRSALEKCDMLIILLRMPYKDDELSFNIRYKTVDFFLNQFVAKDRVLLLPLENTYIFGGVNELTLNAIVAKNYGADTLLLGQNHSGLGTYWDHKKLISRVDTLEKIHITIKLFKQFAYCDKCTTLVSTDTCPHGHHHHVVYDKETLMELFRLGIMPPSILIRKEISSMILADMFPKRKERLERIYQNISTSTGLINPFKCEDFYDGLMDLYHTTSLT